MKIIKLYSNNNDILEPIFFNKGINFVVSNAHSVGKTLLFSLIDYCLMKANKPDLLKNFF